MTSEPTFAKRTEKNSEPLIGVTVSESPVYAGQPSLQAAVGERSKAAEGKGSGFGEGTVL